MNAVAGEGGGNGNHALSWFGVGLLTLVLYLVMYSPFKPGFFNESLDPCYCYCLYQLFVDGARFDLSQFSTFGPYAFIYSRYYLPATFAWTCIAWLTFTLGYWLGCYRLALRTLGNPLLAVAWLTTIGYITALGVRVNSSDVFFYALIALFICTHFFDTGSKKLSVCLSILVGWAALIKFSFTMLSLAVIAGVGLNQLVRQRRFPYLVFSYACALLFFWLLARQPVSGFTGWLANSLLVARDYSQAMSRSGPADELAAYGVSVFLFACFVLSSLRTGELLRNVLLVATSGLFVFVTFKAGFVRHGIGHALHAPHSLLLFALFFVTAAWPLLSKRKRIFGAVMLVPIALLVFVDVCRYRPLDRHLSQAIAITPGWIKPFVVFHPGASPQALKRIHEQSVRQMWLAEGVPIVAGTADFYPWGQSILLGSQLKLSSRPALESHMSYSPELSDSNEQHLYGVNAPQFIFFDIRTIDNRFRSLDDAKSWPVLLSRYSPAMQSQHYAVLRKREDPATFRVKNWKAELVVLGERCSLLLRKDRLLWLSFRPQFTVAGKLLDGLFKAPGLRITVWYQDGRHETCHLPASMCEKGFLLSPVIRNRDDFVQLYSQHWSDRLTGQLVVGFSIAEEPNTWLGPAYRSPIAVQLDELEMPAGN